jgi:hypothetical protein
VQQHVPVGDVGDLVGIGEAKPGCCLQDDAVEDVQFRDLQHVLDRSGPPEATLRMRQSPPPTRAVLCCACSRPTQT